MNNDVIQQAAQPAAEKIVEFTFDEYPDNDMNRGQLTAHVATIITIEPCAKFPC